MRVRTFRSAAVSLLMTAAAARADNPGSADPQQAPELRATVPADYVLHTAGTSGVTLRTPSTWTETPPRTANVKLTVAADGGRSVNLVVVPNAPGATLQVLIDVVPNALAKQFKAFKLLTADYVKLNGVPAARLVYTATFGTRQLELCQFFVIKGDTQYVLTYTSQVALYQELLPAAEAAAVSMKLP